MYPCIPLYRAPFVINLRSKTKQMTKVTSLEAVPQAVEELHNKFDALSEKLSSLVNKVAKQEEQLICASEACKLFVPAISRLTLIRWTKADHVKEYRIGGRVYYKRSQILDAAKHLQKYKSNSIRSNSKN